MVQVVLSEEEEVLSKEEVVLSEEEVVLSEVVLASGQKLLKMIHYQEDQELTEDEKVWRPFYSYSSIVAA